jgi:hypothetical protein
MYLTNYGPRHPAFIEVHEFCGEKVKIINGGNDSVFVVMTEDVIMRDEVWDKVEGLCIKRRNSGGHYYPFEISKKENARDILHRLWWEIEKEICRGDKLNSMANGTN